MAAIAHETSDIEKKSLLVIVRCPKCDSEHTRTDIQCWSAAVMSCSDCEHRWMTDRRRD